MAPSNLALNTSKDGASTTSLGSLFQALTTLLVKNFPLTSNLNLPSFNSKPFPRVLLLSAIDTAIPAVSTRGRSTRNSGSRPLLPPGGERGWDGAERPDMARDPAFVLRYLAEVEELAEDVLAARQQIVDLDVKRNRNREALRALLKDPEPDGKAMVCFGSTFIELHKAKAKEMLQSDQEQLDEEINNLRKELRVKVNRLFEAQGKPELKGFNLNPMSAEEMKLINRILEG
uniref:P53 and DNA damage regulated 1 n=2 Tax=Coturnix japonica TaxID=93934 RepID=A0A8C2T2L6_COTJA